MSYEVGKLGLAVRRAIVATCTPAFAGELLSQRPSLPPGVRAGQVRQRVVRMTPVARLPRAALVLAEVRSDARSGAPGAFELRLVPRHGGWRVVALTVV